MWWLYGRTSDANRVMYIQDQNNIILVGGHKYGPLGPTYLQIKFS